MKTHTKIALIAGLSFVVLVIIFGSTIYYFQNNYAFVDFYKRLETRAKISNQSKLHADALTGENLKSLRNSYLEKLEKEKEYLFVIDKQNTLKMYSDASHLPLEFLKEISQQGTAKGNSGSLFYFGIRDQKDNKTFLIVVSAENYYFSHHLQFLRKMLLVGMVFIIFVVIFISIYFSKVVFEPIKQINQRVQKISTQNIHLRLEPFKNNNEINELILTFNDLLNRIETAFETQKNFISSASHELGTPLTAIIGIADVALLKDRNIDEYKESLNQIVQQAERLNQITKSLLFLAQTGYKGKAIHFERIRVDDVIWQTITVINKLNPQNKVNFDIRLLPEDSKKLKVNGNRELLQLAFANIINNACKYSNNDDVKIAVASSDSNVIIIIEDKGIGIPPSEIGFIYDPFFRANNTHQFEGYGIGLPLTKNIVSLHKGTIHVSSILDKGTTVKITIPVFTQI